MYLVFKYLLSMYLVFKYKKVFSAHLWIILVWKCNSTLPEPRNCMARLLQKSKPYSFMKRLGDVLMICLQWLCLEMRACLR